MLHRGRLVPLAAFALLAGVAIGDANGQSRLFAHPGESEGSDGLADPTVIRGQLVEIDLDLLAGIQPHQGHTLVFNLFDNVSWVAVFERVERRSSDRYTWYGHLPGVTNGTFTLVVEHGVVVANIRAPHQGSYQVRYLAGSGHVVREIDEGKFAPCGTGANHAVGPPAGGAGAGARGGDDGSVIDVLVVYTADARVGAGGTEAMHALIELAVAETNTAFENSLINPRLNLVYQGEIEYVETGDAFIDIERLTDTNDGFMDDVHALRDAYGADMVSLLVEKSNYCGVAWLMTTLSDDFESYAFSVTLHYCATGNYTFGHELGHNMGSHHDRDNADHGVFDYSYGYQAPGEAFRTVMAYDCPDGCPKVQHYSNPDVNYEGQPTGVPIDDPASAHNALSINNAASTVANWRQSADPCAPTILEHPGDATACEDESVAFSVLAEGTPPLKYQWRHDGANIVGATSPTYTINSVSLDDAGEYDAQVTNACGSVLSDPASLTVEDCTECEGDANGDGLVDPLDSGFVLARFGCAVGTGDPNCDTADMNGDGLVDPLDAGYVLARFGPCP